MAKFWILSGTEGNWDIAFKENKWGARKGLENRWKQLSPGDILGFYVTSPISGIIGFGKLTRKREEKTPYWPDEIRTKQAIWPFRFYFDVIYRLPYPDWKEKRLFVRDLRIAYQAGINSLTNKDVVASLLERAKLVWNKDLPLLTEVEVKREEVKKEPQSLHNETIDKLLKIGELRKMYPEKEHQLDGTRLDVIWKRVSDGHPIYAFEVQVGGDVTHALGKLKHAWDKHNSKLYLVTEEKYRGEVNTLLAGTFHEIQDEVTIIPIEKIESLYKAEKEAAKHKEETGLI